MLVYSFRSVSIPVDCPIFVFIGQGLLVNCLLPIFSFKFFSLDRSIGILTPIFLIMMASSCFAFIIVCGLLEIMFSLSHLSVKIDNLEVALDAVTKVTLVLTSQLIGPLEVELFEVAMLLSEAHRDFKVELADEQRIVTLKLVLSGSFEMPVTLDLARGRMLQESSLCSCSNLYELFCSCNLRKSLRFWEVMDLRLLMRQLCLLLNIPYFITYEGVFFFNTLRKLFERDFPRIIHGTSASGHSACK